MRLFGVKMELYCPRHFPSYAAVWSVIALLDSYIKFAHFTGKVHIES